MELDGCENLADCDLLGQMQEACRRSTVMLRTEARRAPRSKAQGRAHSLLLFIRRLFGYIGESFCVPRVLFATIAFDSSSASSCTPFPSPSGTAAATDCACSLLSEVRSSTEPFTITGRVSVGGKAWGDASVSASASADIDTGGGDGEATEVDWRNASSAASASNLSCSRAASCWFRF